MSDTYRKIAEDAIAELRGEEFLTEQEFGVGDPRENYHGSSDELTARLKVLDDVEGRGLA